MKIERGRPELKKGAIPSIFPGQKKPPRRILQYKNGEKKERTQSILRLNGEWEHVNQLEIPKRPERKRTYKRKPVKSPTSVSGIETSGAQVQDIVQKQENLTDSLNEVADNVRTNEFSDADECRPPPTPGLPTVKPYEKEISSACINWDALPLPEEIGSLLCHTPVNASSDFHIQSSKSKRLSPSSPKTSPAPAAQPSEDVSRESLPEEDLSEEHFSEIDSATKHPPKDKNTAVSFQGLRVNISEIQIPSPLWGVHMDQARIYFSCMSYSGGIPRVEKIVIYQGLCDFCKPVNLWFFLRGELQSNI